MLAKDKRRISVDYIETDKLVVGTNVSMGSNASINWGQISNPPSIIDSSTVTYIARNEIATATIRADQIYGNVANLSDSVNIGTPSDYMQSKYINFSNASNNIAKIGLQAGGSLQMWTDSAICPIQLVAKNGVNWNQIDLSVSDGISIYSSIKTVFEGTLDLSKCNIIWGNNKPVATFK